MQCMKRKTIDQIWVKRLLLLLTISWRDLDLVCGDLKAFFCPLTRVIVSWNVSHSLFKPFQAFIRPFCSPPMLHLCLLNTYISWPLLDRFQWGRVLFFPLRWVLVCLSVCEKEGWVVTWLVRVRMWSRPCVLLVVVRFDLGPIIRLFLPFFGLFSIPGPRQPDLFALFGLFCLLCQIEVLLLNGLDKNDRGLPLTSRFHSLFISSKPCNVCCLKVSSHHYQLGK